MGSVPELDFNAAHNSGHPTARRGGVDPATGIIILDDGQTYTLAEGVSVEGLQPGDVVTVSFEVQDDKNMVTAVTKSE